VAPTKNGRNFSLRVMDEKKVDSTLSTGLTKSGLPSKLSFRSSE